MVHGKAWEWGFICWNPSYITPRFSLSQTTPLQQHTYVGSYKRVDECVPCSSVSVSLHCGGVVGWSCASALWQHTIIPLNRASTASSTWGTKHTDNINHWKDTVTQVYTLPLLCICSRIPQTMHVFHHSCFPNYSCWNFDKIQMIFKVITRSSSHAFWWERTVLHFMEMVVWCWSDNLGKNQSWKRYLLWYTKVPYVT